MALSEHEIKSSDTLQLLTRLAKVGFPVGYARIESWHINPGDPSFFALLALYFSEEVRQTDPSSCAHYEIGCFLTHEVLELLNQGDDRNLLYKAVEYIIHFQIFEQMLRKITDKDEALAFVAEKNQVLDELDNELGIDLSTVFALTEQTAAGVHWEEERPAPPEAETTEPSE
jgi:hypothetical protein